MCYGDYISMSRNNDSALFELQQLSHMTPFVLAFSENGNVTWASDAIIRRFRNAVGMNVSQLIEFDEPRENCSVTSVSKRVGQWCKLVLLNVNSLIPLAGRWFTSGNNFVLLATPEPGTSEDLEHFELNDFSENDHLIDLLVARDENVRSLSEASRAAQVLKQKNRETKQAEKKFRESEKRLKIIFDTVNAGIFLIDFETHKIVDVNNAATRMVGARKEEILGNICHQFICPIEKEQCHILDLDQRVDNIESVLLNKDGHEIPILKTVVGIALDDKQYVLDSFVDLSELKQAESHAQSLNKMAKDLRETVEKLNREISERKSIEEALSNSYRELEHTTEKLTRSNQELQEFVYVASHDLREPLRTISSMGKLLQDSIEEKLNEDDQENLDYMIDGAERMTRMIEALLVYSRIDSAEPKFRTIDLSEVIDELKHMKLAAQLNDVRGTILISGTLPLIKGDYTQISQLLQNLIGNALKFQKPGSTPMVEIRCHQDSNGMVKVEIQDNGIGIEEEYLSEIFTMFKRVLPQEEYEGTGIGLSICRKIIERHGGKLGVSSTPGNGSVFWFTLPLEEEVEAAV
jgi:PAS domain S-box-containing protein